jgi:hypothetical protein
MEGTAVKKWHKRKNTAAYLYIFIARWLEKDESYKLDRTSPKSSS